MKKEETLRELIDWVDSQMIKGQAVDPYSVILKLNEILLRDTQNSVQEDIKKQTNIAEMIGVLDVLENLNKEFGKNSGINNLLSKGFEQVKFNFNNNNDSVTPMLEYGVSVFNINTGVIYTFISLDGNFVRLRLGDEYFDVSNNVFDENFSLVGVDLSTEPNKQPIVSVNFCNDAYGEFFYEEFKPYEFVVDTKENLFYRFLFNQNGEVVLKTLESTKNFDYEYFINNFRKCTNEETEQYSRIVTEHDAGVIVETDATNDVEYYFDINDTCYNPITDLEYVIVDMGDEFATLMLIDNEDDEDNDSFDEKFVVSIHFLEKNFLLTSGVSDNDDDDDYDCYIVEGIDNLFEDYEYALDRADIESKTKNAEVNVYGVTRLASFKPQTIISVTEY